MTANGVVSALFVGLVIGGLGRLVVPGRQPIGCLLTVLLGVVGSVAGLALARYFGLVFWPFVLVCQVGVAAAGVAVVAGSLRRGRGRR